MHAEVGMADWAGCEQRRLCVVDSTNLEARRWARAGAPHGAVVIAARQTAGRGRRGRGWLSAPGVGLWFSMVLRPDMPMEKYPLLPFALALAGADACHGVSGGDVQIKWPNDLVLHGRKVAGLLVELEGEAAVMGIGINVRQRLADFPPELRARAGSLDMLTGQCTDMDRLATALIQAIQCRVDAPDFMGEYAARCVTIGSAVRVHAQDEAFEGVAEGLDEIGALLVRTADGGLRRVLAGDVSVRGLMGYV